MKKRMLSFLLALTLVLTCTVPAMAEDNAGGNEIGKIKIYSDYADAQAGDGKWDAVLHDGSLILMTPNNIASITGTDVTTTGNGFCFSRGSYTVSVNITNSTARIILDNLGINPYGYDFSLDYIGKVNLGNQKDVVMLPLEQLLYLLNAQWKCIDGAVYVFSPAETLWNLVDDYSDAVNALPQKSDLFGENGWDYLGNSTMYTILSFGNEISPTVLMPSIGFSSDKLEDALVSLSVPCENMTGSLSTNAEQMFSAYLAHSELMTQLVDYTLTMADGIDFAAMLPFSATSVQASYSNAFTVGAAVVGAAADMVELAMNSTRIWQWSETYVNQMRYLSTVSDDRYLLLDKQINTQAKQLYQEYSNTQVELTKKATGILWEDAATLLLNFSPAGLAMTAYGFGTAILENGSSITGEAFAAGDYAMVAKNLCNLSSFMAIQYGDAVHMLGHEKVSTQLLDDLRLKGGLMEAASAHCWDAMYSTGLVGNATADLNKVKSGLLLDYVDTLRFSETEQYDKGLLLYEDFRNLYSTTAGAYREHIPPEYVIAGLPVQYSSCIGEYEGVVYCTRDVPGLTKLAIKPASYDTISSFAFYKGYLYYFCKDTGTSDYRTALYRCKPDGSEQTLLKDFNDIGGSNRFHISADGLLYPWDGTEYYDTGKETWVETYDEMGFHPGAIPELYNTEYCFFSGNSGYLAAPYEFDDIVKVNYDEATQIVSGDTVHIRLVAAVLDGVYYEMEENNTASLYKYDVEEKTAVLIDSHKATGSGWYFNW